MTRLLNGSRNSVCTTRGEYWLDASWMMSRETENATPANVMVAPAMVLSNALALDRRGQHKRKVLVLIETPVDGQADEPGSESGDDPEHRNEEQARLEPLGPSTQPKSHRSSSHVSPEPRPAGRRVMRANARIPNRFVDDSDSLSQQTGLPTTHSPTSAWESLKRECLQGRVFATRAEARRAIFRWINWYNTKRLHSTLDHVSPLEWERQYLQAS